MSTKKWINETEVRADGKRIRQLPEYIQWKSMRSRCEVGGTAQARDPTYIGCQHSPEWSSYDVWIEWARVQIGFLNTSKEGKIWHQDKDILFKGNKVYSPETCVFIPHRLNTFLISRKADRGEHPVGVRFKKSSSKYGSQVSLGGRVSKHLGYFDTPTEAFAAYKVAKESYAKQLAIKYTGLVDPRVIDALNNFTVNIED